MSKKRAVGCGPSFRKNSSSVICECNAYEGLTSLKPETRLWLLQRWVMQESSITPTWGNEWCLHTMAVPKNLEIGQWASLKEPILLWTKWVEKVRIMWEKLMMLNIGSVSVLQNETDEGDSNSSLSVAGVQTTKRHKAKVTRKRHWHILCQESTKRSAWTEGRDTSHAGNREGPFLGEEGECHLNENDRLLVTEALFLRD